ncbi:TetR/AcrR family transcriptional regulator [Caenibius sp. WL]|uniref:TetR/AcrR family transcriptional regulator n=1 Tax=Caenibius sp. WL TaxID=2872646 RepID=UPI001C99DD52|nr:TetR/AcrR family transcriptional regulator [Caenibius sp. WL]QZP07637.1 TetR/AcrR family transcriptional regulator [Caenibius sp. WL]
MPKLKASPPAVERIINAAEEQFLTHGVWATSVDRIAREARVGKNSYYELFPSKDALFAAVVEQALNRMRVSLSCVRIKGSDLTEVLCNYAYSYLSIVIGREGSGLYRATITAERELPTLSMDLQHAWIAVSDLLTSYFAELIERGVIVSTNPELLAFRFVSCVVDGSRYLNGYAKPSDAEARKIARAATHLFLNGYRTAPAVSIKDVLALTLESEAPTPSEARAAIRMPFERLQGLFDAAMQEFLERGFHGANLDRIVRQAGVSKATLFRHFETKVALFQHVVLREAEDIWGPQIPVTIGATIEETVRALIAGVLDRHLAPRSLALHRLMLAESGRFPAVMAEVSELMRNGPAAQLRRYLLAFGWPVAGPFVCRTFFTLATEGVRWLAGEERPDAQAREEAVAMAVQIVLSGVRLK